MRAKKSLGQNFLNSPSAVRWAVEAAKLTSDDLVLEIGPGRGKLTEALLETGARVLAVEKDPELIAFLQEKFAAQLKSGQLILHEGDILEADAHNLFTYYLLLTTFTTYKLVANIPYYITGQIIRKFLETDFPPELMVLMVQKEVGERIVATDGKESILSLSVKAFGEPRYLKTVSKSSFIPAPSVDSALILIDKISKERLEGVKEEVFFELIKKGFSQKRKQIKGNLEISEEILGKCGIDPKARAEDLKLEDWLKLAKNENN